MEPISVREVMLDENLFIDTDENLLMMMRKLRNDENLVI